MSTRAPAPPSEVSGEAMARPRQLMPREERTASIMRAAATAFAHGGFAATSMEDVAAAAGVTKLIVYRHFASKEDLYRSVLTGVGLRLQAELLRGFSLPQSERRGATTRAILTVARENPDGFRLLMVHAAREPQFAELDERFKAQGREFADAMIATMIADPAVRAWAARMIVEYLVQGVLVWLDVGEASRDDEFIEMTTQGLLSMLLAWVDPAQLTDELRQALAQVQSEQSTLWQSVALPR